MKILENMDLCYGCEACANVCPKKAINMVSADDGFIYPTVDDSLCINCGACQRVCPAINRVYDNFPSPKVFAAMANDDVRAKSASGGVFSLLAEYVLDQGGYVVGAAFDDGYLSVSHIMINSKAELDRLRRSKYIQSRNGDIYKQVKEKLAEGAYVLFTGTPCQCAALKSFLKKPYDKLIIVDLICHGTPSQKAWEGFVKEVSAGKQIADVNFRYKGVIGWSATTYLKFDDGTEYVKLFKDDPFEQAASKNLISRKSCSSCQFARVPRQGDLTIGDFWGISKKYDDRKGTSAILVSTEKGKRVLDDLSAKGSFKTLVEIPFYEAFGKRNPNVCRFPHASPGRARFFEKLNSGAKFSEALEASKSEKYDAVLLSIWYAANYGSLMTNFALYKTLEDKGLNCIFAEIPDHLWPTSVNHRHPLFVTRRFAYKHFKLTPKYKNRTDLKKLNDVADCFIVGSDQIWNYQLCKSADTYFFLDFVEEHKKKIAYGTSFGHSSFRGSEENKKAAGYYLNRFDFVSVREDYAVDLCQNDFGVSAREVLDPVFMCDKKHYLECIKESAVGKDPPRRDYVLAYILDPTEEKQRAIEDMAARFDADIICIPNAKVSADMKKAWRLPIKENIDMEDWLWYFKNAKAVVTDSFHGTCFSIIFERPFVAIENRRRGAARFASLLNKFGLEDRLVDSASDIIGNDAFLSDVDYAKVNEKLNELRQDSMAWLDAALASSKKPTVYSSYDITDKRIDAVIKDANAKQEATIKELEALKKLVKDQKTELANLNELYSQSIKKLEEQFEEQLEENRQALLEQKLTEEQRWLLLATEKRKVFQKSIKNQLEPPPTEGA